MAEGIDDRHLGVCRSTNYVGDTLVIQPDGLGGVGGASGFGEETLHNACSAGFLYRPLDPRMQGNDVDPEGSCSLDVAWEGGVAYCRPIHDQRVMAMCPKLEKGEALMYGGTDAVISIVIIRTSGKVQLGTYGETVACVRAPELIQWIDSLESLLTTMGGATLPPTSAAVTAWKSATATIKEALKAKKVEVT